MGCLRVGGMGGGAYVIGGIGVPAYRGKWDAYV